jgi:hypothetical protein
MVGPAFLVAWKNASTPVLWRGDLHALTSAQPRFVDQA